MAGATPHRRLKLHYTGQPIIDVGVATIVAFSGRATPDQVTDDDADALGEYLMDVYMREPLKSFLSTIYPNSAYASPTMKDDKRQATMLQLLRAYRAPLLTPHTLCAMCAEPAQAMAFRQHLPLTAGETIINFGASGRPGVPLCGGCLLASQTFVLGSVIKGRALLVHSDDPATTLAFARTFLAANRQRLSLALAAEDEAKTSYPRTIVISRLLDIKHDVPDLEIGAVTAYHLTNYGPSANITMYALPSEVVDFLEMVGADQYRPAWQAIVAQAWETGKGKKGADAPPTGPRRNRLYDDLFTLFAQPDTLAKFLRRYFVVGAAQSARSLPEATAARFSVFSWPLVDLFLRKVVRMDKYRITVLQNVGDRLAQVIMEDNDTSLLRTIYIARSYRDLRVALLRQNTSQVRNGAPPIIGFDDFVSLFEHSEDVARTDWSLARDLMYLRVLDRLYTQGWFSQHAEAADDILAVEATDPESASA